MFKYDMGATIPTILAKSELRNARDGVAKSGRHRHRCNRLRNRTGRADNPMHRPQLGRGRSCRSSVDDSQGVAPSNDDVIGLPNHLTLNGKRGDEMHVPTALN
jgi:hypothetical protein